MVPVLVGVEEHSSALELLRPVRGRSLSQFGGGVMVSPAGCAGVSVQLRSSFLLPADRTAAAGSPVSLHDALPISSVSVSAEVMLSGIAVSSVPTAGATVSVG